MRVLVTGAGNPTGEAIVRSLVAEGHTVRLFGVGPEVADRFGEDVAWFPGRIDVGGSIEPVLSERQAVIHVACLDPPGRDRKAHAVRIERGTLYTRYGAEREQVDHFVHVAPREDKVYREAQDRAVTVVEQMRGPIHWKVLHTAPGGPEETARHVLDALREGGRLGKQPGRETDAVTA